MTSSGSTFTILELETIPSSSPSSSSHHQTSDIVLSSPYTKCSVCAFEASNLRKLKTHLLLKHPELNLCLFCVEKKGWSDNFVSQNHYNQHYRVHHEGTIANKSRAVRRKATTRQVNMAKNHLCFQCPHKPTFVSGIEFDRHMISIHGHDYCKFCNLIGPTPTVRYHVLDEHPGQLCHVCGSQSPVFDAQGPDLNSHLFRSHGFSPDPTHKQPLYPCYDCDSHNSPIFQSSKEYREHLLTSHLTKGDILKPMRKKRVSKVPNKNSSQPEETSSNINYVQEENEIGSNLKRVVAIRNESGQDCFAISVLHLLAQTEVLTHLEVIEHHSSCLDPSCILAHFLERYRSSQKRTLSVQKIAENYNSFGITELPMDVGDFMRSCLNSLSKSPKEHRGEKDVESLYNVSLQWKFECPKCKRFMVTSLKDSVLRIDGSEPGSFGDLLNNFLHRKFCSSCQNVCEVFPGVKSAGKYLFVEVDRSKKDDSNSKEDVKELALYSLQLNPSYNVFGFRYSVFGCVNYNLEVDRGGHYVTNLFLPDQIDCVRIHEHEWKTVKRKPDFDCDTVIVALQKVEMTIQDLRCIEMEIEYEHVPLASTSQ